MCGKSKVVILGKTYSGKLEFVSELMKLPFYSNSLLEIYTDNPEKADTLGYAYVDTDKLKKMERYEKIRRLYEHDGYLYGIKQKDIKYAKLAMVTTDMLSDYPEFRDFGTIFVNADETSHMKRISRIKDPVSREKMENLMVAEEKLYTLANPEEYDIIIKENTVSDPINLKNVVYYIQSILRK
jgi:hypothetical protein